MIRFDYAAAQIGAVWKMGWNRPGWEEALDRSVDGVFKSFWAIILAAPFSFLGFYSARQFAARLPEAPESFLADTPFAVSFAVHAIAYLADWGAQLATLVICARALSVGSRITDIIVGFNWTQFIVTTAQAAPFTLLALTQAGAYASILFLPVSIFVLAFIWGFLRRSFAARVPPTIGLMVLLLLVGLFTNLVLSGLASLVLQLGS